MTNALLLNKVTSKQEVNTHRGMRTLYTLHDGTEVLTKDDLDVNSWYFFEIETTPFGRRFVSSASVPHADAAEYEELLSKLKHSVFQLEKAWKQLNTNERQIVMRSFGLAIGGVTTAGFITSAFAEEAILGSLTGGLSTVFAIGSAAFTYLQFEELKEALKLHIALMNEFQRQKAVFTRKVMRFTPPQYDDLPIADPEFKSVVSRLKSVITNITSENFLSLDFQDMKFAGVHA